MTTLATTHDTIYQGRCGLEQPRTGYRFGTDAMVLAAAVQARSGQKVLELGCGVGAVLIAAHTRLPEVFFTGIEKMPEYAHLAKKNIERNAAAKRVHVVRGDALNPVTVGALGSFDHVVANPPYYETQRHSGAASELRRVARQHDETALAAWMQAANRALKPKGTVTFIHATEKLDDLIQGLQKYCGGVKIFPLWPKEGEPSKRLIIQATKGSKAPLTILPGLVMHEADGRSTMAAFQVVNEGRSLWD